MPEQREREKKHLFFLAMLPVFSGAEKLFFQTWLYVSPGETDSINSSYFINQGSEF